MPENLGRTEAAAKALSAAWHNMHTNESLGYQKMLAEHALSAADAVMFSDEAVNKAEQSVIDEFLVEWETGEYSATAVYGTPAEIVRAVIESLKAK